MVFGIRRPQAVFIDIWISSFSKTRMQTTFGFTTILFISLLEKRLLRSLISLINTKKQLLGCKIQLGGVKSCMKSKIQFDYLYGPIWKEKLDAETGEWSTDIPCIDNDVRQSSVLIPKRVPCMSRSSLSTPRIMAVALIPSALPKSKASRSLLHRSWLTG